MKLIKITDENYIIVDDSEIKIDDWYLDDTNTPRQAITECESYWTHRKSYKKITHSTDINFNEVYYIPLQEVKELIGEVDVEKKVKEYYKKDTTLNNPSSFKAGYNQALEDNKDKKYTEEDIRKAFFGGGNFKDIEQFDFFIKTLQPKTEWEVELNGGKINLADSK